MIEGHPSDTSSRSPGPGLDRRWASLREQVREIIRAEVAKLHPTEDARRALELIIESSVRYTQVNGAPKITVVDKEGHPRRIERNGQHVDATIHDLLEELRMSHPVLFRSPPKADADAALAEKSETADTGGPKVFAAPEEKPQRDWIALTDDQAPTGDASSTGTGRVLFHLQRGKIRLHGWSHKALATLARSASEPITFPFVQGRFARSAESARRFMDGLRERTSSRPRGLALGALALVALIGAGALVLSARDRSPPSRAAMDGPSETGAVTSSAPTAHAPAFASSGGQALRGVPDVIDTATLSLQGEVVRLFGVEWAPGGGKPDDLTQYLQGREVACEPAGGNDTYRCTVGGQDLSRVVLFNGGGKPTPEATPELKAAADKAREAKLGVWSQQQ